MEKLFSIFVDAVLWTFSFGELPLSKWLSRFRERTDAENIRSDWERIGKDIRRIYNTGIDHDNSSI